MATAARTKEEMMVFSKNCMSRTWMITAKVRRVAIFPFILYVATEAFGMLPWSISECAHRALGLLRRVSYDMKSIFHSLFHSIRPIGSLIGAGICSEAERTEYRLCMDTC